MTGIAKYTTIRELRLFMPDRHIVNNAIDRSGAQLSDYDVVRKVEDHIDDASREMDGYLRRYLTIPIDPTVTPLSGTLTFTRGSRLVTGVTTLFSSELKIDDEVRPDSAENYRVIVESVVDDFSFMAQDVHYLEAPSPLSGSASVYEPNVPAEVEILVRGHLAYILWGRRGTNANNPMVDRERFYEKTIAEIKKGEFRIESVANGKQVEKPSVTKYYRYDGSRVRKTFTDRRVRDYLP